MIPHPILAPSLLAANHAALGDEAKSIEAMGLQWVHLDIMDAHFVPNLSFSPQLLRDLRPLVGLFFDTHLMLDEPHRYVDAFIDAGAQNITIHVEPDYPLEKTLKHIRERNCSVGLALNPGTPAEAIKPYLELIDVALVMTVQPGFGGQTFREAMLSKITQIHTWRQETELLFRIEVDGGIDTTTGLRCAQAGADTFVAGNAFFKAKDRRAFAAALQS